MFSNFSDNCVIQLSNLNVKMYSKKYHIGALSILTIVDSRSESLFVFLLSPYDHQKTGRTI